MARTKQTARKPTGGKAPRKSLKAYMQKFRGGRRQAASDNSNGRKPHRYRPGTVALREIRKCQRHTGFFLARKPFFDAVHSVLSETSPDRFNASWRVSYKAMDTLQMGMEAALIRFLENGLLCTLHCKRVTLNDRDLRLVGSMVPGIGNKCQEKNYSS